MKAKKVILAVCAGTLAALACVAERPDSVAYSVSAIGGGATRQFNPYLLGSNNRGLTPMGGTALLDAGVSKDFDLGSRFSWEAGVEVAGGYSHKAPYQRFDAASGAWTTAERGPAPIWLQQLYASVKWRGVFISAGMRNRDPEIVDATLSSGDLVEGVNARAIPQVRAGFVDFQNIPFTRGWVQIKGSLAYGKMAENSYLRDHYNYYSGHIATGTLYTYKDIYFRSNPAKPLHVTIGVQSAGFFGGTTEWYTEGQLVRTAKNRQNFKAFCEMLIPKKGNADGYVDGSHLGSWDFRATYRFRGAHELSGYFEWLWEDGSSMGRRNKWDGLWGLEYRRPGRHVIEGAVLEYIDFRDQSGPMHWAPGDHPGTTITSEATGGDDYYNNSAFNAYANLGMSLGTPFVVSPIYNTDGYLQFKHTRSRGFHAAARGSIADRWQWRAALSYAVAWGQGRFHYNEPRHNTSALAEVKWLQPFNVSNLSAAAAVAFDAGSLRGNNFGAMLTLTYSGNITFSK